MKYELEQTHHFANWFSSKKIKPFKNRLLARFERIKNGNFGDHKTVARDLFELRFFFASGLRVYYTIRHNTVVLLLVGGDKTSQPDDIDKAKALLDELE